MLDPPYPVMNQWRDRCRLVSSASHAFSNASCSALSWASCCWNDTQRLSASGHCYRNARSYLQQSASFSNGMFICA